MIIPFAAVVLGDTPGFSDISVNGGTLPARYSNRPDRTRLSASSAVRISRIPRIPDGKTIPTGCVSGNPWPSMPRARTSRTYVAGMQQGLIPESLLKQWGDDLSRENIAKQALNIRGLVLPMSIPGLKVNTGPANNQAYNELRLQRWNGPSWEAFGSNPGHRGPQVRRIVRRGL